MDTKITRIEKAVSGNIQLKNAGGEIVASLSSAMCVLAHPSDANGILISNNPNPQMTSGAYVIYSNTITSTAKAGVSTAFSGTRDQLISLLTTGADFFY